MIFFSVQNADHTESADLNLLEETSHKSNPLELREPTNRNIAEDLPAVTNSEVVWFSVLRDGAYSTCVY